MYFLSATIATVLLGAAMSAPAPALMKRSYFSCASTNSSGFNPSCCTAINGQVGINCIGAHIIGVTNPIYQCNLFVYNITGCCQTTGFKNPYTNNTLDLCATQIDPI